MSMNYSRTDGMKTSTEMSPPAKENSRFYRMTPGSDVTSKSHAKKVIATTVQITPTRAPPEITSAVSRQRQAVGIIYSKDYPYLHNPKQTFQAVINGPFSHDPAHYIITSSHNLDSRSPTNYDSSKSFVVYNGNCSYRKSTRGNENHGINAGSPGLSKYGSLEGHAAAIYNRRDNSRGQNIVGRDEVKSKRNSSSTSKVILENPYRANISRTVTDSSLMSFSGDAIAPEKWKSTSDASSGSIEVSKEGISNVHTNEEFSKFSKVTRAENTYTLLPINVGTRSPYRDLQMQSTLQNSSLHETGQASSLQQDILNAISPIQFADSILGALNTDLSQIYHLCKTKFRYSDYIEKTLPHIFPELSKSEDNEQNQIDASIVSSYKPHFKHPSTQHTPPFLTPARLSSPRLSPRTLTFNWADQPIRSRQGCALSASWESKQPKTLHKQKVNRDSAVFGAEEEHVKEPLIDYDTTVDVIVNAGISTQHRTTKRSILKTCRTELVKNHLNNSFNDKNINERASMYAEAQFTYSGEENLSNVALVTEEQSLEKAWTSLECLSKEKGKLVRFSSDNTIHEFVPFDEEITN